MHWQMSDDRGNDVVLHLRRGEAGEGGGVGVVLAAVAAAAAAAAAACGYGWSHCILPAAVAVSVYTRVPMTHTCLAIASRTSPTHHNITSSPSPSHTGTTASDSVAMIRFGE